MLWAGDFYGSLLNVHGRNALVLIWLIIHRSSFTEIDCIALRQEASAKGSAKASTGAVSAETGPKQKHSIF